MQGTVASASYVTYNNVMRWVTCHSIQKETEAQRSTSDSRIRALNH